MENRGRGDCRDQHSGHRCRIFRNTRRYASRVPRDQYGGRMLCDSERTTANLEFTLRRGNRPRTSRHHTPHQLPCCGEAKVLASLASRLPRKLTRLLPSPSPQSSHQRFRAALPQRQIWRKCRYLFHHRHLILGINNTFQTARLGGEMGWFWEILLQDWEAS